MKSHPFKEGRAGADWQASPMNEGESRGGMEGEEVSTLLQLYTYRKKRRWVVTTRFWVIITILAVIVAYFVFRNVSMQDLCTSPYWRYVFSK